MTKISLGKRNLAFRGANPMTLKRTSFARGEGVSQAAYFEQGGFYDMVLGEGSVRGTGSWKVSVVYRCIAAIAETIASMPFTLKVKKDGGKYPAEAFGGYEIYATDPNKHLTWFEFMLTLVSTSLNDGNGYALIIRDGFGYIKELRLLESGACTPYVEDLNNGDVSVHYWIYGKMYSEGDVLHIKCLGSTGYVGESILSLAKKAILGGRSQQDFNNSLYDNGLNLQGVIEAPHDLSEEATDKINTAMTRFRGAKNSNGTLILEEGIKYSPMSMNPIDAQFVESRNFTVRDICRFFGVPLSKVNDLSNSTNNNIEQQDLDFYKATIMPWCTRIEQQFDKKGLSRLERRRMLHEFDTSSLLRGDYKARAALYNAMFPKGAISPNEIRAMENHNPSSDEGMDEKYMQLAMSSVPKLDENRGKTDNNAQGTGAEGNGNTTDSKNTDNE